MKNTNMVNLFSLDGKNAWVTGACYGIGFAIAKAFAQAGADNIIFNARSQEAIDKALADYHAAGEAFTFLGFTGKPAGYFIMFCFCGLAYLVGWCIMKALVPKYSPVEI